jgi:radical SAM superfamily enzyme YgiQ (UPF0313 family)
MKALLISTYELGHQPLGLAQPLAHLRAAGIDARGNDLAVEPLDEAAAAEADLVGISAPMHTALRLGVRAAQRVRALNPQAHLCFYGLYAGLNADYLLRTCAGSVLGGEVEEPLVQTALAVAARRPVEPAVTNLGRQRFLVPERGSLPGLEQYARLDNGGSYHLAGAVEASRGCAHQCLHCPLTPVYGGRLRIVPAEVVLADVRQLVEAGAEHITFADPDFFNGVRHSMAIARALHAEFPHVTFDATIKVEHLLEHQALLPELHELGCLFITSAVESLSDTVLRNLDKGHTAADVETALALTRAAGIALRPTLLPFTPWTALDDYLDLLHFVEQEGLLSAVEPVQLAIRLLVPPGSALLRSPAMQPYLGELDEAAFAYRWHHPDPRLDALAEQVAVLVEAAARNGEDPAQTFARIRALAESACGPSPRPSPDAGRGGGDSDAARVGAQFTAPAQPELEPAAGGGRDARAPRNQARVPGLTEAWFC